MTSDKNDTIVDKDGDKSEVDMDQNNNYVYISEFGLENAPHLYYTNDWEGFVGEL